MKPPLNGCVVLEHLRAYGFSLSASDPDVLPVFSEARQLITRTDLIAFHQPVFPVQENELIDYLPMRPPYPRMWVETVYPDEGGIGYFVTTRAARDFPEFDLPDGSLALSIVAFGLRQAQKPVAVAAMQFIIDQAGRKLQPTAFAPVYGPPEDQENRDKTESLIFPCCRILQRLNYTNIGFYQERDPDETNPRLTRQHRRKLMGRRYYVLVIRNESDMRAGRKVVTHRGERPLHWRRGHRKHFGPASVHGHPDGRDRGLAFGWLAGVFYIEPKAIGDAKNGVIDKDYRLAAVEPVEQPAAAMTTTIRPVTIAFQRATDPTNRDVKQPQPQEAR